MHLQLLPGSRDFFTLLEALANEANEGAYGLLPLLEDFDRAEEMSPRPPVIERESDGIFHDLLGELNIGSLSEPPKKDDLYRLASNLEGLLDEIEAAAESVTLVRGIESLSQMVGLSELLAGATDLTVSAVPYLRDSNANAEKLREYVISIHALVDEGDRLHRRTAAYLSNGILSAIDVMRFRETTRSICRALDRVEAFARTVEMIVIKSVDRRHL